MNDQDRPHESYRPPESQDDLNKHLASKYGHPSSYPVTDNELVGTPFYRRPQFYLPFLVALIAILLAIIIIKPFNFGKTGADKTPYYDEAVLTFPDGTTDWRLSPESRHSWPQYLCLIDNKWHQCYPQFVDPTSMPDSAR